MEIEELKDELATIVMTQTSISGRDKWDTPEIKMPNGKKGRLIKGQVFFPTDSEYGGPFYH